MAGKAFLRPAHETHTFSFVTSLTHLGCTGLGHHVANPLAVVVDIRFDAVEFAQQNASASTG